MRRIILLLVLSLLAVASHATGGLKRPAAVWTNVTGGVGGASWGYGGVTTMYALPTGDVLAGISQRGLWTTRNGGATWAQLGSSGQIGNRPYQIVVDPKNPAVFWESGNNSPDGVYKTTDGGLSFTPCGSMNGTDGISVDFSDEYRRTLLVAQHHNTNSLYMSVSSGAAWIAIGDRLPSDSDYNSDVLIVDEKVYLANSAGGSAGRKPGIFRSADGGRVWTRVSAAPAYLPPLVASDGTIYWCTMNEGKVVKSADKGATWEPLVGPAHSALIEMPDGALAGFDEHSLYVSRDKGKSWTPLGPKLPAKPSGLVYTAGQGFFIYYSSGTRVPNAIFRWRP